LTIDEFCKLRPSVYHVTSVGAIEQIRRHGLLSTAAILELVGYQGDQFERLFSRRRTSSEEISDPVHGVFILRDQKPLPETQLRKCLPTGIEPRQWYEALNSRVFMWIKWKSVNGLRSAKQYRDQDQQVLTLDSKKLLAAYYDKACVSFINTGYALRRPARRGSDTFLPVRDCSAQRLKDAVELTIEGRVADIEKFIESD
jgi:hypothetical protein